MHTVNVSLGDRSYPIYIGRGLLDRPELLQRHIPGKKVLVVTNETVAPLYLDRWEPNVLCISLIISRCRSSRVPCTSATDEQLPQAEHSAHLMAKCSFLASKLQMAYWLPTVTPCAGACRRCRRAASTTLRQLCCRTASSSSQSRF